MRFVYGMVLGAFFTALIGSAGARHTQPPTDFLEEHRRVSHARYLAESERNELRHRCRELQGQLSHYERTRRDVTNPFGVPAPAAEMIPAQHLEIPVREVKP